MPINPDDDISNAVNIARQDMGANAIQSKVSGLNQFMAGLDLEANPFNPHTGLNSPSIGGAGMPSAPPRQLNDIGLYSHAAEQANTLQPRGDAKQMISTLKNMPGVKPEELQNAGLLDAQGNVHPEWAGRGKITNTDLANHLQSSMPQVQETILGFNPSEVAAARAKAESQGNNWDELGPVNQGRYIRSVSGRRLTDYQDDPKYAQYTLPGGENYREVLLHLPPKGLLPLQEGEYARLSELSNTRNRTPEQLAEYYDLAARYGSEGMNLAPEEVFNQNHFPDIKNLLAHLRMSDRTGPNGEKILHVEELQSDWGQKGRDEGFANLELQKQKQDLRDKKNALVEQQIASRRQLLDQYKIDKQPFEDAYASVMQPYENRFANESYKKSFIDEYNAAADKALEQHKHLLDPAQEKFNSLNKQNEDYYRSQIKELNDQYNSLPKNGSIPSAPYVTNTGSWTDLALKRALKEAAEGGYDKLVWTPGSEQAQRYDLSKQIGSLTYNPQTRSFRAYKPVQPEQGEGATNGGLAFGHVIPSEKISDYVGKDVAEKLLSSNPDEMGIHRLEGQELSVGGEGMKSYYDSIVPKQLQKVTKQYDPNAKVGYTDVMLPPSGKAGTNNPPIQAPGIDITPQMREAIMRGQKAFKRGGFTENHDENIKHALRLATGGRAHFDDGGDVRGGDNPGGLSGDTGAYAFRDVGESQGAVNAATARAQDAQQAMREWESHPTASSFSTDAPNTTRSIQEASPVSTAIPLSAGVDPADTAMAKQVLGQQRQEAFNTAQAQANAVENRLQGMEMATAPSLGATTFGANNGIVPAGSFVPLGAAPGTVAAEEVAKLPFGIDPKDLKADVSQLGQKMPSMQPTDFSKFGQLGFNAGAAGTPLSSLAAAEPQHYEPLGNQITSNQNSIVSDALMKAATFEPSQNAALRAQRDAIQQNLGQVTTPQTPSGLGSVTPADLPAAKTAPQAETSAVANEAPRIPVDSLEDPALIAAYNAKYNLVGPRNAYADMTLGQRIPNITTNNPLINTVQGANNFLTDLFTPNYKLGSDEYNKISQNAERQPETSFGGHGGGQQQLPIETVAAPVAVTPAAAPVVPGTPVPFTYAKRTPYLDYGAYSAGIGNVAPISYRDPINWALVPGYRATGGRVGENNALANAIRLLAMQNRS